MLLIGQILRKHPKIEAVILEKTFHSNNLEKIICFWNKIFNFPFTFGGFKILLKKKFDKTPSSSPSFLLEDRIMFDLTSIIELGSIFCNRPNFEFWLTWTIMNNNSTSSVNCVNLLCKFSSKIHFNNFSFFVTFPFPRVF